MLLCNAIFPLVILYNWLLNTWRFILYPSVLLNYFEIVLSLVFWGFPDNYPVICKQTFLSFPITTPIVLSFLSVVLHICSTMLYTRDNEHPHFVYDFSVYRKMLALGFRCMYACMLICIYESHVKDLSIPVFLKL